MITDIQTLRIIFFNSKRQSFLKTKPSGLKVPINVREDDSRPRNSIVKKGKIKLNNRNIDVHCFGIGGYFGPVELKELAYKWNKYLSNKTL